MSTSTDTTSKTSSNAGRYLFLFLIGLVIGAISVVMLVRTWESRKTAEDRWHDSVMNILAVHSGRLDASVKASRCAATDLIPSLQAMRTMANDLEPAFPDLADDQRFKDHAGNFRRVIDGALATPPLNCAGAGTMQQDIGNACKACHQDFRG